MEIHPCPTGHRPFGTAAQKQLRSVISWCFSRLLLNQDRPSDRLMNRRADGQTKPFYRITWLQLKQGRIHGNPVADGWAGAQMRKQLGFQKCYGRMDQPTDTARCRVACPRLKMSVESYYTWIKIKQSQHLIVPCGRQEHKAKHETKHKSKRP